VALILVQDSVFETLAGLLNSTKIKLRKEAVLCVTQVLTTLDKVRVLALLTETFPSLLKDYLKCMQFFSDNEIVMSVLETVYYFLEVDENLGYEGERSFKYLIEIN